METKNPDFVMLWSTCQVDLNRVSETKVICDTIAYHIDSYKAVEKATNVPWYLVAALHYRESSLSFKTYLHNGDLLGKPTTHVPRGVFFRTDQWTEAAIDAVKMDNLDKVTYKDTVSALVMAEKFNGMGYRKTGELSPYVWAATNHSDETGKYTNDGHFNPYAVEKQLGVAAIFKELGLK